MLRPVIAGIGPDRTTIEIWADPTVACHCPAVAVDAARCKLHAPLRIGT